MDSIPNKISFRYPGSTGIIHQTNFFNTILSVKRLVTTPATDNNCYYLVVDDIKHDYIEGAGGEYYDYDGYHGDPQLHRTLVYFKKSTETWGNPIDFDLLLSVDPKRNYQITSEIFPNPFTDHSVLKIKNENKQTYQVTLSDTFGKIAKEYSFNGEELIIENDGSMNGMYFYKLYNSQKDEVGSGKLIIH